MTVTLFILRHAAMTAILAATAWAAGRAVLRRWATPAPAALAVAVGLAVLAQALFLLGLCGGLRPWPILALALAAHLLAVSDWRRVTAAGSEFRRALAGYGGAAMGAAGLFAVLSWTLTLYPPLAFDETLYHLPFTRAFADSGALPFLGDLRFPVFPQLAEILAVPLFLFGDDVDTHAISWLATLAVAGLLVSWHGQERDRGAGELSAAFWLGAPIVVYLAGVGYVEPLLALFVAGACYSYARAASGGAAGWGGARGWWLLAGFLAGSAASLKYHGLFFLAGLGVAILAGRRWRPALLYAGAALGALLPSYARIVLHTGNPLFPYYPKLFGASLWTPPGLAAPSPRSNWLEFLSMPWRLVFDRLSIGGLPPHSPALLLALPLALYGAVREPRARLPLLLAAAYAVAAPMDARYVTLALPVLAVAAGLGAARWRWLAGHVRRARMVALLLLLPGVVYALFSVCRRGPLPATPAARERYLETWLPLYPAVRFLNDRGDRGDRELNGYTAYALSGEEMVYWARGRWLGDHVGAGAYSRVQPLFEDPPALHAALRTLGVQYLVLPRGRPPALEPGWRLPVELFPVLYRDPLAEIYAVVEPPPPPAR